MATVNVLLDSQRDSYPLHRMNKATKLPLCCLRSVERIGAVHNLTPLLGSNSLRGALSITGQHGFRQYSISLRPRRPVLQPSSQYILKANKAHQIRSFTANMEEYHEIADETLEHLLVFMEEFIEVFPRADVDLAVCTA